MSKNEKIRNTKFPWKDFIYSIIILLAFIYGGFSYGIVFLLFYVIIKQKRFKKKIKELQEKNKEYEEKITEKTSTLQSLRQLFEETDKKLIHAQNENQILLKIKEKYQGIINVEEEIMRQKLLATKELNTIQENIEFLNNKIESDKIFLKALQNNIEGYGSQYILPTYSIFDKFTQNLEHTEANAELKKAQKESNLIIKSDEAVLSDAPFANSIKALLLIAFNSQIDKIFTQSKKANYGILEQKIKDIFTITNNYAKEFYKSSITKKYLNARLNELKWCVILAELKNQLQEEQRQLREKMRDEERARKEYDKAIKDAEKEEQRLHLAMEKARNEILAATEAEKKNLEKKLLELEIKLKETEERGQRAISMAQQTKRGNVYIISNIGSFGENIYKIGMTRRLDPYERIKELGDASVPFPFDVHAVITCDDAPALEANLHKEFSMMQVNKVNHRKEFFKINLKEIRKVIEEKKLEVSWSMIAAATEYRETLAIEKKLSYGDSSEKEKWELFSNLLEGQ